jgi:hypothetical protein
VAGIHILQAVRWEADKHGCKAQAGPGSGHTKGSAWSGVVSLELLRVCAKYVPCSSQLVYCSMVNLVESIVKRYR